MGCSGQGHKSGQATPTTPSSTTRRNSSSNKMISSRQIAAVVILVVTQLLWTTQAFAPTPAKTPAVTTEVFYRNPQDLVDSNNAVSTPTHPKKVSLKKKPTIYSLKTLDELQYFLEEDDDRLVAIKFFAPWCKSCQRLGQHFQKLAMDLGDGVVNRQKVAGQIRFAQVEYSDETKRFLTEQLQVRQVPTLQLYLQKNKVWEESGMTNTKSLQTTLQDLPTDPSELLAHAMSVDDGILEGAIDEAFYESPSFLDEEW